MAKALIIYDNYVDCPAPYNALAVIGVWRSAARYQGPGGHAKLARIATVTVVPVLSVT